MSDLFRQEVIDRQTSRHLGEVILAAPKTLLFYIGLVLGLFGIGVCILAVGSFKVEDKFSGKIDASLKDGFYEISLNGDPETLAAIENDQILSLFISGEEPRLLTVKTSGPVVTLPGEDKNIYAIAIKVKAKNDFEPRLELGQKFDAVLSVRRQKISTLIFGNSARTANVR